MLMNRQETIREFDDFDNCRVGGSPGSITAVGVHPQMEIIHSQTLAGLNARLLLWRFVQRSSYNRRTKLRV